jgi:CheY-like chemotaxis protein
MEMDFEKLPLFKTTHALVSSNTVELKESRIMPQWFVDLIPHLLWVTALLFVILRFPNLFREFVAGIKKLSITDEGIELERAVKTATEVISEREGSADTKEIHRSLARLPLGKRILWVDDHPDGNSLEKASIEAAGITVIQALSNKEASEKFAGVDFHLVISDISRDNEESGLDLPRTLCVDRNRIPPIIYYVRNVEAVRTSDGYPVTSKPSRLFEWIGDILRLQISTKGGNV